jgi:hemerythrin-like metal-binding protein
VAYIDWTDSLSVGIDIIDEQHKVLIKIINDLHEAMKAGQSKSIIKDVLARLIDYTGFHFSTEEKLMDKYGYPEAAGHKKIHKDLVDDVLELQKKLDKSELTLGVHVLTFLKTWLNDHILKTDMKFGGFLKQKGIK